MNHQPYIGRFAPSPTGPLHAGSLLAAVASWLDARAHRGRWLLRIEDLDPPREIAGAADSIRRTLDAHGLYWDGPVSYQSERDTAYHAACGQLAEAGVLFRCTCTRREIRAAGGVYPGTCRHLGRALNGLGAIRVRVEDASIAVSDRRTGRVRQNLARELGDFIIRRRDGLFAYQLAVVVDDAAAGVTHVVRGMDLLSSTPRQVHLQRLLRLPTPRYLHHPVLCAPGAGKLSKQSGAPPVDATTPRANLSRALEALGLSPPAALAGADARELLAWALAELPATGLAAAPDTRAGRLRVRP